MRVKYFIVDLYFDICPYCLCQAPAVIQWGVAYVRSLMQPLIAATMASNPAGPPPSKKTKNDVRAATLKLVIVVRYALEDTRYLNIHNCN